MSMYNQVANEFSGLTRRRKMLRWSLRMGGKQKKKLTSQASKFVFFPLTSSYPTDISGAFEALGDYWHVKPLLSSVALSI